MEVFEKVNTAYAMKRERAYEVAARRESSLHERFPEFAAIDGELRATVSQLSAAIRRGGPDIRSRIEAVKKRNLELQQERARLLEARGLPSDYTEPVFECEKCRDSGYIGTRMCECFRRALREERYYSAGLGKALEHMTFETLNPTLAAGKPEGGVTPRENLAANIEICRTFAANVAKKPQYLMLFGGTGLGKTHITAATCRAAIDNGCDVVYDGIQNILRAFREDEQSAASRYIDCRLLAIDDFGTEYLSAYSMSVIYNIFNTRMLAERSMLVNSNLELKDMEKRYDKRIQSRILGSFKLIRFFGEDVRKLLAAGYKG